MTHKASKGFSQDSGICRHVGVLSTAFGSEYYFALEAPVSARSFQDALHTLFGTYSDLLRERSLGTESEVHVHFYLSDIVNQAGYLQQYLRDRSTTALCSLVGQPPASGSKCGLTAYHVQGQGNTIKNKHDDESVSLRHNRYVSLWTASAPDSIGPASSQTMELFTALSERLAAHALALREHLLRTWIYIRDIDLLYEEFNRARSGCFDSIGLLDRGWYPASTGIGGSGQRPYDLVSMDALSVSGLEPGQVHVLDAPDHLCPAYSYNVSFERGLRTIFGDRTHYYISGTASIDERGDALFPGDVRAQASRAIDNIRALLESGRAGLSDIKLLIVYLRDFTDFRTIHAHLEDIVPSGIPRIIVQGAVCRPAWLVEIEAMAVSATGDNRFAPYF